MLRFIIFFAICVVLFLFVMRACYKDDLTHAEKAQIIAPEPPDSYDHSKSKEVKIPTHGTQKVTSANSWNKSAPKAKQKQNVGSNTAAINSEAEFVKKYPGDWNFLRGENEEIRSVLGGLIPEAAQDESSINLLAQQLKPLLAKGDYELQNSQRENETDLMMSYEVSQSVQGHPVYQGSAQFLGRKEDDAVYMINNRLKDLDRFSNTINVSLEKARQSLESQYPNAISVTAKNESPVAFSLGQRQELAWVFLVVHTEQPPKKEEVVVSANDGKTVHREARTKR